MEIIIQAIQTVWTKASRGGPGATRRNAVAEAFPLPLPDHRRGTVLPAYFLHQLHCAERAAFHPVPQPLTTGALLDMLSIDQLSIHPPDDTGIVRVTYHPRKPTYLSYARDDSGEYRPGGHEALALRIGEWGRVRYNWRHGATVSVDDWWYDLWVVNVGFFTELRADAFLESPPNRVYSQLSRLR
jgi:hypothetical protein